MGDEQAWTEIARVGDVASAAPSTATMATGASTSETCSASSRVELTSIIGPQ